jgi:opacity protein-like surface antigen
MVNLGGLHRIGITALFLVLVCSNAGLAGDRVEVFALFGAFHHPPHENIRSWNPGFSGGALFHLNDTISVEGVFMNVSAPTFNYYGTYVSYTENGRASFLLSDVVVDFQRSAQSHPFIFWGIGWAHFVSTTRYLDQQFRDQVTQNQFSLDIGGGYKWNISRRFGIRSELRYTVPAGEYVTSLGRTSLAISSGVAFRF